MYEWVHVSVSAYVVRWVCVWVCVHGCLWAVFVSVCTCVSLCVHVGESALLSLCDAPMRERTWSCAPHLSSCWYYHFGFPSLAGDAELNTDALVPKQNHEKIWSPHSLNLQPIKLGTSPALFYFLHWMGVELSGATLVLIEELTLSQGIYSCWNPRQNGDSKLQWEGKEAMRGGKRPLPSSQEWEVAAHFLRNRSTKERTQGGPGKEIRQRLAHLWSWFALDLGLAWWVVLTMKGTEGMGSSWKYFHVQPLISWLGKGRPSWEATSLSPRGNRGLGSLTPSPGLPGPRGSNGRGGLGPGLPDCLITLLSENKFSSLIWSLSSWTRLTWVFWFYFNTSVQHGDSN